MHVPRCKMEDVYLSSSGKSHFLSFLTKSARCHRCCYLFTISRWTHVPRKPSSEHLDQQAGVDRRVA